MNSLDSFINKLVKEEICENLQSELLALLAKIAKKDDKSLKLIGERTFKFLIKKLKTNIFKNSSTLDKCLYLMCLIAREKKEEILDILVNNNAKDILKNFLNQGDDNITQRCKVLITLTSNHEKNVNKFKVEENPSSRK